MADATDIDSRLRALKPLIDKKADQSTAALKACEKLLDELSLGFSAELVVDRQDSPRRDDDDTEQRIGPFKEFVELQYKRGSDGKFALVLVTGRWDEDTEDYSEPPSVYPCAQAPRGLRILVTPAHILGIKTQILKQAQQFVGNSVSGPVIYAATTEADKTR